MVRSFRKEWIQYPYMGKQGRPEFLNVLYTLYFENGTLVDIRNSDHTSVVPTSECGQFFHKKYGS